MDPSIFTSERLAHYWEAGILRDPLQALTLHLVDPRKIANVEARLGGEALVPEAVIAAACESHPVGLARFLSALAVPDVGEAEVEALVRVAGSFDELLGLEASIADAPPAGTSPAAWRSLVEFLCSSRHKERLRQIAQVALPSIEMPAA